MRSTLTMRSIIGLATAAMLVASAGPVAASDSAFISQLPAGSRVSLVAPPVATASAATPNHLGRTPQFAPSQQTAVPVGAGTNLAATLQVGAHNRVTQMQIGGNNTSAVGVIGYHNNVGVLQAGNNLRSNLVLLGTQGLNVGVIQPNGSAPINMIIARLPNGGLLIKR